MTTALVFSAGGMFGAYQAGACKALAEVFRPDLIVGASAGALNAWAIAGGCSPDELCNSWTDGEQADIMHLRFPALPWRGVFQPEPLRRKVELLFGRYQPRTPFAITLVDVLRMRPVCIAGDQITPAHLLASCAIPFGYPPVRIDGRYYVDGGLLAAVPLWAAAHMGATTAVVVNALPMMPSRILRTTVGAFRAMAAPPADFPNLEIIEVRPAGPLGSVRDAISWKEENARRWIAQGECDARACFARLAQTTLS